MAHQGHTTSEIISIFMGLRTSSLIVDAKVAPLAKREIARVIVFNMWLPLSSNGLTAVLLGMLVKGKSLLQYFVSLCVYLTKKNDASASFRGFVRFLLRL